MIEHISFDVWLTLIYSNQTFKSKRNDLIVNTFGVKKSIESLNTTFRRFDKTFTKVNEIVGKNLDSHEMLLIILAELDIDLESIVPSQLEDYEINLLNLFWKYPPFLIDNNFPKVAEKLVNQGISLSILSNTGFIKGVTLRQLFDYYKIGHFFAFQCYSDEEKYSKPSAQFYEIAYRKILAIKQIEKNKILHIGDNSIADVYGASQFGFYSALYQREITNIEDIVRKNGIF